MKEYVISSSQEGMSMINFLMRSLPGAGKNLLYAQLRKKNINLNRKKAAGSEKLKAGDRVQVFFSDETLEKFESLSPEKIPKGPMESDKVRKREQNASENRPGGTKSEPGAVKSRPGEAKGRVRVLFENEDIIALDKDAGVLSQRDDSEGISMNEELIAYLMAKGEVDEESLKTVRPSVCNRLDRNTSGVLLCGKTIRGLKDLSRQLKEHSLHKCYLCIVKGDARELTGIYKGYITKNRSENRSIVSDTPRSRDSKEVVTGFEFIGLKKCGEDIVSLVSCRLYTGRSHQIRAHLLRLGYPMAGDVKYGDKKLNAYLKRTYGVNRQLLHGGYIRLEDGTRIISPLPADFGWFDIKMDTELYKEM